MSYKMSNVKEKNRFLKEKKEGNISSRWKKIKAEIQNENIFKQPAPLFRRKHYERRDESESRYKQSFFKRKVPPPKPKIEFNLEKMNKDFPSLSESINKLK